MHFFDILNTMSKIAPAGSPRPSRVQLSRILRGAGAAWPLLNCAPCTNGCLAVTECGGGESDNGSDGRSECGSGGGGRQADRCRLGIINRYTNIRKTYGKWGRSHCHIIKNYRGITKSYTFYNSQKMPMPPPFLAFRVFGLP